MAAKSETTVQSRSDNPVRSVKVRYFALLKEERGLAEETITTGAPTLLDLYIELQQRHNFALPAEQLRVAVDDAFVDFASPLREGDVVVFVPPVAGG